MYSYSSLPKEMAELNNHSSWWSSELSNYDNNDELTVALLYFSMLILSIFWYKITFSSSSSSSLPPGPRGVPIIGYIPFLTRDLHKQFQTMAQTYGPIFKFYIGGKLHIVINNQAMLKTVIRDHDEAFSNRHLTVAASVFTYGGQDVTFSNNPYWRDIRKIFVHEIVNKKNVDATFFLIKDEVRKTIKNLYTKTGTIVNVNDFSHSTSMSIMTSLVRGDTMDQGVEDRQLVAELEDTISKCFDLLGHPNVSDIFPSLAWLDVQGVKRDMTKEHKKLDQIITTIINNRIKSNAKKIDDGIVHEGKKDFLQVLLDLEEQKVINMTQIKALIVDFLIGGAESATTMTHWTMSIVMKNHKAMKKIQDELAEVVGVNNIVEESHLPKLEYLDATFRETFRLYPPAALMLPRLPSQECVVGGYTIPKDSTVLLNVYAIQRDPKYWDNPDEFIPERFLGQKKFDYNGTNLSYLPFGSGRRLCPGLPLADKMLLYMLASFLHSFDWRLPEGEKHDISDKLALSLKREHPLNAIPSQRLPNSSLYM